MMLRTLLAGLSAHCLTCLPRQPRYPSLPLQVSPATLLPPHSVAALMTIALAAFITAPAAAVHRCESGGKVSYSDLPCPGASRLKIDDAPPASRKPVETDASQQRQAAELARLQQLRELRERQDQRIRDLAARGAAAREKKCRTLAMQRKWHEEDLRDASLKQEGNARKRLRRMEERYREECR